MAPLLAWSWPGHQATSREQYGQAVRGRCHHLNALMLRCPRPAPTCSFPLSLSSMQRSSRGGAQMGASAELSVLPSPSTTPPLWQGPHPPPSSRDLSLRFWSVLNHARHSGPRRGRRAEPPAPASRQSKALHLGPGAHADVSTCASTCEHSRLGGFSGPQLPSRPPCIAAPEGPSAPARRITQLRARKACTHREPSAPRPPYTSTRRASPAAAAIPPPRSAAAAAAARIADAAPPPAPPRPPSGPRGTRAAAAPQPSPLLPPSARHPPELGLPPPRAQEGTLYSVTPWRDTHWET